MKANKKPILNYPERSAIRELITVVAGKRVTPEQA
jgi:hypothetical protein